MIDCLLRQIAHRSVGEEFCQLTRYGHPHAPYLRVYFSRPQGASSLETGAGGVTPQIYSPEESRRIRDHQANGMDGLPLVGDPDSIARDMAQLAALGRRGVAISFVNYLDQLPHLCAELPRLARSGVRDRDAAPRPASP